MIATDVENMLLEAYGGEVRRTRDAELVKMHCVLDGPDAAEQDDLNGMDTRWTDEEPAHCYEQYPRLDSLVASNKVSATSSLSCKSFVSVLH